MIHLQHIPLLVIAYTDLTLIISKVLKLLQHDIHFYFCGTGNLLLQRGDPGRPEEEVLMRALRDFNIPKVVTDDVPVFMGLIGDLFPALDVPRKRDQEFERTVKQAATDLSLQPEDNFILKVHYF